MSQQPQLERITYVECRQRISDLEAEAGYLADELRVMRETWEMTVRQRDILDQIENYEYLSGDIPYE